MAISNVAALVVSLASFALSTLLLFKGFFESAEGYKKCGRPMIGPWSRITWRRWRWFELRFETHFIAPKISIHPRPADGRVASRAGWTSLREVKPTTNEGLRFSWRPTSRWSRSYAFDHCKEVLEETLEAEGAGVKTILELELESQRRRSAKTFAFDNKVSWLLLIRSLYDVANMHITTVKSSPPARPDVHPSSTHTTRPGARKRSALTSNAHPSSAPIAQAKAKATNSSVLTSNAHPSSAPTAQAKAINPTALTSNAQPSSAPIAQAKATISSALTSNSHPSSAPTAQAKAINPSALTSNTQPFSTRVPQAEARKPSALTSNAQPSSTRDSQEEARFKLTRDLDALVHAFPLEMMQATGVTPPPGLLPTPGYPKEHSPPKAKFKRNKDRVVTSDTRHTEFVLAFVEWTWDIMPKDASRPMAKITLGELIILGYRLGMKWRINLDTESFTAHGHGFALVCTRQGDMGLVASLNNDGWPDKAYSLPQLSPNRATDKLMCGIIPVSRTLVGEDIHCTSDKGETNVFSAVVDRIDRTAHGVLRELVRKVTEMDNLSESTASSEIFSDEESQADTRSISTHSFYRDPYQFDPKRVCLAIVANEAVCLLCEYLPLPHASSSTNLHYFPGWASHAGGSQRYSVLGQPEGWYDLLLKLRGLIETNIGSEEDNSTAQQILESLLELVHSFSKIGHLPEHLALECRDIFDGINDWFRKQGYNEDPASRKRSYVDIVAAHCYMALKTMKAKMATFKDGWDGSVFYSIFETYVGEIALSVGEQEGYFYNYLWSGDVETSRYWVFPSREERQEIIEESALAWCFMVLRGVAWSLSTKGMAMGEAVPSSLFDHPRNVWIV